MVDAVFSFNRHNVCLTPEMYKRWGEGIDSWYITLAEFEGKWDHGIRMSGGACMGCAWSPTNKGKFNSRQEAIDDAVAILKENAELSLKKPVSVNNSHEHRKFAKMFLDWYIYNILQPTLF